MNRTLRIGLLLGSGFICLSSCSLVTVPVKTAGKIVETTVKTVGGVAESPFTRGRGRERSESKSERDDSQ